MTRTKNALWSSATTTSPWARLAAARVAPQNGQSMPVTVRSGQGVGPLSPRRTMATAAQAATTPIMAVAGPSMRDVPMARAAWSMEVLTGQG